MHPEPLRVPSYAFSAIRAGNEAVQRSNPRVSKGKWTMLATLLPSLTADRYPQIRRYATTLRADFWSAAARRRFLKAVAMTPPPLITPSCSASPLAHLATRIHLFGSIHARRHRAGAGQSGVMPPHSTKKRCSPFRTTAGFVGKGLP